MQNQVDLFKATPGAISVCEFFAISHLAGLAPSQGIFCSLGSHAGKDAIAAVSGWQDHPAWKGHRYYLVDPCYDLTNAKAWGQAVQKEAKNMPWGYVNDPDFNQKVSSRVIEANMHCVPTLLGEASLDAIPLMLKYENNTDYTPGVAVHNTDGSGKFSYVFSDSDDHNYDLIKAENDLIIPNMLKGGIIVFHDFGNYAPPVQIHKELVEGGQFENVVIPWDAIIEKVKALNLEQGNNSWHCCQTEFPCFVGAVRKL